MTDAATILAQAAKRNQLRAASLGVVRDLQRVLDLPIADAVTKAQREALVASLRLHVAAPPLYPAQADALAALAAQRPPGGILGLIPVGYGKTLVALLSATVTGCQRPVILTRAALLPQMRRDYSTWSKHYRMVEPEIVAYETLSQAAHADILDRLDPDILILDEAHCVRRRSSARTKRLLRFARSHPDVRYVVVSGTLLSKSIYELGHLAELALREGTPLPLHDQTLARWGTVIDPWGEPDEYAEADLEPLRQWAGTTDARAAFAQRLRSTPGVVVTDGQGGPPVSLAMFSAGAGPLPQSVTTALSHLEETWETPDGRELIQASEVAQLATSLSLGWYYRPEWPNGEIDHEWVEARLAWHRAVASVLRYHPRAGCDSPALVERTVRAGRYLQGLRNVLARWDAVRHRPGPAKTTVWLPGGREWLLSTVEAWMSKHPQGGVVWYHHEAVGEALADLLPVHGQGSDEPRTTFAAASIPVWSGGANLQHYHQALVLEPPTSGLRWEQLLGRLHRGGQTEDVDYYILQHTRRYRTALYKAQVEAEAYEQTTNERQRMNYLSWGV